MIPLIITPEVKARAREIKEYALQHPWSVEELMAIVSQVPGGRNAGDDPNLVLLISEGFKVVYSIEDQSIALGRVHHLSISLPGHPDRRPHPAAFMEVAKLFGIEARSLMDAVAVWDEGLAINALFRYECEKTEEN